MWTWRFWRATAERAVKTFAQGVGGAIVGGAVTPASIGWKAALAVGGVAAVLSVLSSVGSARVSGEPDSPSLVADP